MSESTKRVTRTKQLGDSDNPSLMRRKESYYGSRDGGAAGDPAARDPVGARDPARGVEGVAAAPGGAKATRTRPPQACRETPTRHGPGHATSQAAGAP